MSSSQNDNRNPLTDNYEFDAEFERSRATNVLRHTDLWARKQDAAAMIAALDALGEAQKLLKELHGVLLMVARDAHGPGYPEGHLFNGGPVKMHGHTLMLVDEAIALRPGGKIPIHDWPTEVHEQYLVALDERDALQAQLDREHSLPVWKRFFEMLSAGVFDK